MNKLDWLFINVRNTIFSIIQEKNINIDSLAFDLCIDRDEFEKSFQYRNKNFCFYLKTLSLVEHWEG